MSKTNLDLKIYYTEPDSRPMKILAVAEKSKFYSLQNNFVDPLNYRNKHINKDDITKVKNLEEGKEIDLSRIRTDIYKRLKAIV